MQQGKRSTQTALLLATVLVSASACQGPEKRVTNEQDSEVFMTESSVGALNSVLNDSEQANSYATLESKIDLIRSAYAGTCDLGRFSPAIGSSDCQGTVDDKTITSSFASCTVGRSDEYVLQGDVSLRFDSPATCNTWVQGLGLPISGNVARTTSSFVRINPNGSRVLTDSISHTNYLGQNIGGGVTTSFAPGSRSVAINGLHRMRIANSGYRVFDHSVTTLTPIVVSGNRIAGNRAVVSGSIRVDHNLARYSTTANFAGLRWDTSCCHPTSGSITFNLLGSKAGSIALDFATGSCGEVFISKNGNPNGKIELSSCE